MELPVVGEELPTAGNEVMNAQYCGGTHITYSNQDDGGATLQCSLVLNDDAIGFFLRFHYVAPFSDLQPPH